MSDMIGVVGTIVCSSFTDQDTSADSSDLTQQPPNCNTKLKQYLLNFGCKMILDNLEEVCVVLYW